MIGSLGRQWFTRLSARFAVVVALALLPIGVVAALQTRAVENEVRARASSALLGETLRAAEAEILIIRHAQGLLAGLAPSIASVVDDPQACSELVRKAAEEEPLASVVVFVPANGLMSCSDSGKTHDYSKDPLFIETNAKRSPSLYVNKHGPLSGQSILGLAHPVFDSNNDYIGYVSLALPHAELVSLHLSAPDAPATADQPILFWSFSADGTILTSSVDMSLVDQQLPRDLRLADLDDRQGTLFDAVARNGSTLTYAVVPVVESDLYLISSWNTDALADTGAPRLKPYIPVALMWVMGLLVSAFAAERLVTRHVRELNKAIVKFAEGDRRLEPIEMEDAPVEIRELADAYASMTENIMRGEADLEHNIHQKEVLLREVHHRVKNNLQLISSIMNIQYRNVVGNEAKDLIKNLQERIMSLATVHRGLYQTSGLVDVKARELIPDIVRQIVALSSGPERPFEVELDIDDLRFVPDQAVPLALLLTEALTNAIKHAGASPGRPAKLRVSLRRSGGSEVILEVCNSVLSTAATVPADGRGFGRQLIAAFVAQLHGRMELRAEEAAYCFSVAFDVDPLSYAEHRQFDDSDATGTEA